MKSLKETSVRLMFFLFIAKLSKNFYRQKYQVLNFVVLFSQAIEMPSYLFKEIVGLVKKLEVLNMFLNPIRVSAAIRK